MASLITYDSEHSKGVLTVIAVAVVSAVTVIIYLGFSCYHSYRAWKNRTHGLFHGTRMQPYITSLLLADLARAGGMLICVDWIYMSEVQEGAFCNAQAILYLIGNVGTAFWSMGVSAQLFNLLFTRLRVRRVGAYAILAGVWALIFVDALVGPALNGGEKSDNFFRPEGGWLCGISGAFPRQQVVIEYLPIAVATIFNLCAFAAIILRLCGKLYISGRQIKIRQSKRDEELQIQAEVDGIDPRVFAIAKCMSCLPILYIVLALPIAVVAIASQAGKSAPFSIMIMSSILYTLSGTIDVIVLIVTNYAMPAPVSSEFITSTKGSISRRPTSASLSDELRIDIDAFPTTPVQLRSTGQRQNQWFNCRPVSQSTESDYSTSPSHKEVNLSNSTAPPQPPEIVERAASPFSLWGRWLSAQRGLPSHDAYLNGSNLSLASPPAPKYHYVRTSVLLADSRNPLEMMKDFV